MPILAAYPILEAPPQVDYAALADSRSLAFESLDGQTLLPATSREFFFQQGIDGLGMPPREIITKRIPGMDGAKVKEIRTGVREIFLPLFLDDDSSHVGYLDKLDELAALFDYRTGDYAANDGTLNLVATSARGERRLRCTYQAGMDTGYGTDNEGNTWASLGLKFLCVQPYWQGDRWQTPPIQVPASLAWFGSFPPRLSSSRAFGSDIPVTVRGDAESWITVDLVGPATSVTISGPGLLVSIPAGLSSGEKARIVTDPRGRKATFSGVTDWARVGPATTWRPLKPGVQKLGIVVAGAATGTSAVVSGPTLWERPW